MYQYPNYIHYLSAEHFHWKKLFNGSKDLCTKEYDRAALCHYLSLSIRQLPLLATLKGNDIVSIEHLERFHRWLIGKERGPIDHHQVIEALANYIVQENLPIGEAVYRKTREITHFIFFGDMSKQKLVEKSLRSYFLKEINFQPQSSKECPWLALVEMQKPGSKLRSVMEGGFTEASTRLEEYRISSDFPPPISMFLSNFYCRLC